MANGFDIGIDFIEPDDNGKKQGTEPKATKGTTSSTSPSATQLARMKEIEAKYLKGKATGPEVIEYLSLAKVKIGTGLKELLSKGTTYAGGKEVLRGKPLSLVEERRGHPNEQKNRLKAQMTRAMDKAAKSILSQAVDTQPSLEIAADIASQAIESVKSENAQTEAKVKRAKAIAKGKELANAKRLIEGAETKAKLVESINRFNETASKVAPKPMVPPPVASKSVFENYEQELEAEALKEQRDRLLSDIKSASEVFESTSIESAIQRSKEYKSRSTYVEMPIDDFLRMAHSLEDPKGNPAKREALSKALSSGEKLREVPMLSFQRDKEGSRFISGHEGRHRALTLKELGYTHMPVQVTGDIRWSEQQKTDKPSMDYLEEWPKQLTTENNEVVQFPFSRSGEYQGISSDTRIKSAVLKEVDTKLKDLFSYGTEENAQQYEEREAKRKQEQASKQKELEDKARKMVEDSIMPVEESLKDITDSVAKIGTGGAGSGGGDKGPKAPPGFDDDDGMDDDGGGYNREDYDPLPTLRARIENLQRTFESTLYAEKESNLFSSLQKTFEKGRKAQDLDAVQKNIEEEVRSQMKLLLAFETRNENQRNLLEATLIEKIRKEEGKEEPNALVISWLEDRLAEVKESRNKIQDEFKKIEADITRTLSERAMSGFAQGTIERDIRELENQAREEDKIIDTYMKQFSKYVKASYKEIAKEKGFEVARQFMEANKDKMSRDELLKKMQVAFDKEVARIMESIPTETELTTEEIVAAHQAGQGKFAPETFKPKGALPEYTQRQPGASGGGSGTGGPGTPTATGGEDPDYIPPSRQNLRALLPGPKVDMEKVRENFARFALIQQATKPMVAASTPQGVSGSQVLGSAATVGAGAISLGLIGGPLANIVVGVTQMTGILAEIAENTIKEVTPFSPELTMAKVEQSLNRLAINMKIANQNSGDSAIYQKSSNSLSNQLYELGADLFDVADLQLSAIFDTLTIFASIVRIIVIVVVRMFELLETVAWPIYLAIRKIKESLQWIANLVDTGINGRNNKIPNYTEDFMANDPRRQNNNRVP